MPLAKVFRLGPTTQRVSKGYVLAGDPQRVARFRASYEGRDINQFEVRLPRAPRAIQLRSPWVLMADPEIRGAFQASMSATVVELVRLARQHGLTLLPSAVRPHNAGHWADWTCADEHEIAMPSTTEAEVVSNAFRRDSAALIALTGRSAIDGRLARGWSCRLLNSTEELTARYVTSASPRNLQQVTSELRRTSGIQSLDVMDVYPAARGPMGLSCTIRSVDAQALVDTTLAHMILVQAMAMRYRRDARRGSRVGHVPDRLLQRQRATAISLGLSGRVPIEGDRRAGKAGDERRTSIETLARQLADDLAPEFGSLQATFREVAPAIGWTIDGTQPRGENEYLIRAGLLSPELLARAVGDRAQHLRLPSMTTAGPDIATMWEQLITEPPGSVRQGRPERPRNSATGRTESGRPASGSTSKKRDTVQKPSDSVERRNALMAVRDAVEETRRATVATLIAQLPKRTAEIIPFQRGAEDDVRAARAAGRPGVSARRELRAAEFSPRNFRVAEAVELARIQGWSLLSLKGSRDEARNLVNPLAEFLDSVDGCRGAILGVAIFRAQNGEQQSTTEVVLIGEDPS